MLSLEFPKAQLMTTPEVMSLLRISKTQVYRLKGDGEIEAIRIGADWRYSTESLRKYVRRQTAKTGREVTR